MNQNKKNKTYDEVKSEIIAASEEEAKAYQAFYDSIQELQAKKAREHNERKINQYFIYALLFLLGIIVGFVIYNNIPGVIPSMCLR